MAFAYLIDPENQFMTKWGTINVDGFLRVFDAATDDPIVTYSDFHGTANPERIALDNNGRAVVIADSDRAYRLEVYDRYGSLMWTTSPLWCQASGGGVPGTDVISSDGSVSVDKITVGSMTTFDLSAHVEDSTDLLNWIRCDGGINIAGTDIWKPTYSAGSMVVGNRGVRLDADQYYHVTARVRAQKSGAAAYYDDLQLILKTDDGDTVSEVARKGVVVDASMGLYQDFEISADVLAGSDCELLLEITGKELDVINFQLLDMEVHRVYSGAPHLPPGTLRAEQADWTETDDTKSSYIRHKPDLSLYVTDSELDTILDGYATTQAMDTALAGKQNVLTAGSNIVIENDVISATAEPQLQANWDEDDSSSVQYIQNRPDLSVYATTQAMDTALAGKQDVLTAGANVQINGTTISATDTTYSAGNGLNLAGTTFSADTTVLATKSDIPGTKDLVAGQNITIAEGATTVTISATAAPQQQADWTESDDAKPSFIRHKPTIPVLPDTKDLVAGANVTITEGDHSVTIAATDTTYTAGSGLDLTGTEFSVDTNTVALKNDLPIQQQLVPMYSLPADAGKVLTAGSTTYWSSLSDYVTDTELSTILQGYQEALTAGSNIQISNGVISATDTTYTAGNGLALSGTEFSVDTSVVATQADLANYTPTASLAAVALSNDYNDLSNLPTVKPMVGGNNITITEGSSDISVACDITVGTVTL